MLDRQITGEQYDMLQSEPSRAGYFDLSHLLLQSGGELRRLFRIDPKTRPGYFQLVF